MSSHLDFMLRIVGMWVLPWDFFLVALLYFTLHDGDSVDELHKLNRAGERLA